MEYHQDAIRQAMALAGSPAGQQLLRLLRETGGADFEKVRQHAASGDLTGVKEHLSSWMADPEVRRLLQQMGGGNGSAGR